MFSENTPMCLYKKSEASFSLAAFSFSATGQLPKQRTHHKDAMAINFVWLTTSFDQPSFFRQTHNCERKLFCVIFVENCLLYIQFYEFCFFVDFVEMSFCLDCTPLFTSTVWKSLLNLCLLFSAVINFNVIECFFESFTNFTESFKSYKMANSRSFSSTPSYDFVCFLTSA